MTIALAAFVAASAAGCTDPGRSSAPRVAGVQCADAGFSQFDFWLGEWEIAQRFRSEDGSWIRLPARTMVSASPDHCVVVESWSGEVQFFWEGMERPETMWGFSMRRYDPQDDSWSIYWIDSRHAGFGAPHVGSFSGERGDFYRVDEVSDGKRLNRISFVQRSPRSVDWSLSVSGNNGASWTELWFMEMTR